MSNFTNNKLEIVFYKGVYILLKHAVKLKLAFCNSNRSGMI